MDARFLLTLLAVACLATVISEASTATSPTTPTTAAPTNAPTTASPNAPTTASPGGNHGGPGAHNTQDGTDSSDCSLLRVSGFLVTGLTLMTSLLFSHMTS